MLTTSPLVLHAFLPVCDVDVQRARVRSANDDDDFFVKWIAEASWMFESTHLRE